VAGPHVQTGSTDQNGRLVSGNLESAEVMDNGRIAIKLTRYLNGNHVPAGNDPLGRPWRTAVHVREDSQLFATLEAA
jgi:hypothetical protein